MPCLQSHSAGSLPLTWRTYCSGSYRNSSSFYHCATVPYPLLYPLSRTARVLPTLIAPRMAPTRTARNAPITRTAMLSGNEVETNGRREKYAGRTFPIRMKVLPTTSLRKEQLFFHHHHHHRGIYSSTRTLSFFGSDVIPKLLARLSLSPFPLPFMHLFFRLGPFPPPDSAKVTGSEDHGPGRTSAAVSTRGHNEIRPYL